MIALAAGILAVLGAIFFAFGGKPNPVNTTGTDSPSKISLSSPKNTAQTGGRQASFSDKPAICAIGGYSEDCGGTVFIEPDEPKISLKNSIFEEKADFEADFSGGNIKFIDQAEKIIKKGLELAGLVPAGSSVSPASSQKTLTDEEVFVRLWPETYRNALVGIQNVIIKDGIITGNIRETALTPDIGPEDSEPLANWSIPDGEKITVFKSDADIYRANLLILYYAFKNGYITETEYNNFKKGITELLPKIVEIEKAYIRQGGTGSQSSVLPGYQSLSSDNSSIEFLFKNIFEGLKYVFYVAEPANAAWIRGGDCYKDDAPYPGAPPLGYNGATFCCNCGFVHRSRCRWSFRFDCGTGGSACDIQLGCLNRICGGTPNAIWDPSSGLCGCG